MNQDQSPKSELEPLLPFSFQKKKSDSNLDEFELHEFKTPPHQDSPGLELISLRSLSPQKKSSDSKLSLDDLNEIELTEFVNDFELSTEEQKEKEKAIDEDDQQADPAPTELKFNSNLIPTKKIPVYSLDAEITTLLAKLSYRIVELAKLELASNDLSYRVDELKGIDWNPFLTRKYGSFAFTLLPHDQPDYWNSVETLFVNVFGSDDAQPIFNDLMSILPDGVTILVHSDNDAPSIMYEYTALYNLEGLFASAKQYIDDQKDREPVKLQAIQKTINEKYRQITDQIQLILEKPAEAEKAFNLRLFFEGGKIHHNNHVQLLGKITLQFYQEILAQLSHLEFPLRSPRLPDDLLFNKVFNQFNKYLGMMKKNNIKLSGDLLHIYFTQSIPHTIFYNLHQSPTQAQKLQDLADQKKSSALNLVDDDDKEEIFLPNNDGELPKVSMSELLKLEPQASTSSELNRLPHRCKTTHGIWWQDPSTGVETQVGIESTKFHTPLTKTIKTTNPYHLALNVLLNLQQQAQEARRNKIVSYLLNYNQTGTGAFLSYEFIQSFSLFLSHEISPIIDDSVNKRTHLTSHTLFEIMQTAIENFKTKFPEVEIPEDVLFTLAGAATEIAYSRTIYTHVLDLNDKIKYQYDALRMAQYWMEYPAATGLEPTHPGFIYFVWPITDESNTYGSIGDIKPHINRLNEASMIELFLLFKKYFFEDNIVETTKSLDFKPYCDIRMPMIAAASRYHLNLITPLTQQTACKVAVLVDRELDSLDTHERASVAAGDYIFILEKKDSFQLCFQTGKTIQSEPMLDQEVFPNLTLIVMNAKKGKNQYIPLTDEKDLTRVFSLCKSWGGTPRRKNEEIEKSQERRQQEIIDSLAEFKIAEQAFFDAVQPIYLKVKEKILDSKPTTEAGMVLKLLFKELLTGYFKNLGLKPALTHLLVFFMNERDGLSLQAAGGSDQPDDRWLHVEKIFNTLKVYGFNRERLSDLDRSPIENVIPLTHRSGRRSEIQERTQPSSKDLLILSANNHPFFQFWLERKPSSALDAHTLKLYQYCASHWLSLKDRLPLTQEIKITENHQGKEREDLYKLNSFYQREARKIEVQLLEVKESKYDFELPNNPLAEAIDRFYIHLTHYLLSKKDEIDLYCTEHKKNLHPQLAKILIELTKNHTTLLEKFEFIETCNYLGLELSSKPIERSGHFFKSKYKQTVNRYACLNPVRSIFIEISSLNFTTQEDFIYSLNYKINKIHPNDTYRYLFKVIPHLDPLISEEKWPSEEEKLIYEELEKVKKYCNEGDLKLIQTEIKIPFKTTKLGQESLGKLQIYWQQQRLLLHIMKDENIFAATINEFYNQFRKLMPQFKKDLQNWEVARICRERETVTDKYNFIIDLYYLGKLNNTEKNYDSVDFSNITILISRYVVFNDANKFLSSLSNHVMDYVAIPNNPYAALT